MKFFFTALSLCSLLSCAHLSKAQAEQQVADIERAFAQSMAKRDAQAFRVMLSKETVFIGRKVLRGPDEVMAFWQRFFEGPQAPFSWEPQTVEVLPSGTLAYSSGPVRDPAGTVIATYNSIWRLEEGEWKIVFDYGCDVCVCAEKKD